MKLFISFLFGVSLISCNKSASADKIKDFKLHSIDSISAKNHITKSKVTFLEVGSESCYSCKIMGKNIEDVKNKRKNFNVIFVDVYKDPTGLENFNVKAIPTQIILNNKEEELYRHVGILTSDEIVSVVKKYNIDK